MAPSQSYIPPVSPQAPINVLTTSMTVSDPAGLAGTIVPLTQQTQPTATPMQLTDIIPQAAPQQTQPVMIPQQTIVQQQQIGMDPQISTLQQQPQQQMEAQATLLEQQQQQQQQVSTTQPPTEQHPQSVSATAVQTHQHEPQQQIYVQQPVPAVHTAPQQQVLPTQTGMEQRAMSLPQPGEQPQTYKPQPTGDPREQTMIQPQQLQQQLQQQQTLLQQQQQQALLLEQHQTYVQQQLDQQQQKALLQQQQQQQAQLKQHQLEQQQALIHKQLLDQQQQQTLIQQQQEQQQQGLLQQQQTQQVILQHQLEQQQQQPPLQQQQQSQLYQQIGQHQAGIQKEPEKQQQQQIVLQQQPQQTQQQKEQQLQQQALLRQIEQQQQQALIEQHLQQQAILQQHQLQQKAQLQQQQQEQQQVQLKQQIEQQQQALLQQQLEQQRQQQVLLQQQQAERLQQQALLQQQIQEQQAAIIQLQQTEKQEAVPIPQVASNSEQQIQQQPSSIPQLNTAQFPPHTTLTQQQVIEQQQHAALIQQQKQQQQQQQQQQAFVSHPQHHTSVMESHIPVGAPASTEMIQHQTQIVSQAQVPMAIQTMQIPVQTSVVPAQVLTQQGQSEAHPQNQGQVPVQFKAQSTVQAAQAVIEAQVTPPVAVIQGQTHIIQTQQIPLQTSYPGPAAPKQSQVTGQPIIQTQPQHLTMSQSQPPHVQAATVDAQMMGQQSQAVVQPPVAITSIANQIQHETLVQQNVQMPGLMQAQLQQQTQGQTPIQVHAQAAAGLLTPQYVPQPTHQAMPSLQQDITHIKQQQQQQESVLQYQQMILSPGSAGSVGTTTDSLSSAVDPTNFVATPHPVQKAGQAYVPGQTTQHPAVQTQQQPQGSTADPSVIQPISQPTMPQSTGQYQQQLQKLSQAQQPLAPAPPQPQLLAQPIPTPIQQPLPPKQPLIPFEESQLSAPPTSHLMTHPTAHIVPSNVAGTQSPYSHLAAGASPSPQHQAKQMLPAHTHTQTSIQAQMHSQTQTQVQTQAHSHTQTHTETPIAEQPVLPHAVFPAQQMPLSPSHTSCPPTSLPSLASLPSYHPAAAPVPELPTSPPAAQVTLPGQADFIPTSPPPVTTLQPLDSNAPKLPQASLQDCDLSLLGIAQDGPYLSSTERHSSSGSVPANGEEALQLLANGKLEKLKTQRRASSQRPEKVSHQFQLSMLQVSGSGDNMVECQLETHSNKMVTFKFDIEGDAPEDIADYMVEEDFVLDVEKEKFVEELRAIVKKAHEILQTHSLWIQCPTQSPVGRWRFFINQTIRHRDSLSSQGAVTPPPTSETRIPGSPKTERAVESERSQSAESLASMASPPCPSLAATSPPVSTVSAPASVALSVTAGPAPNTTASESIFVPTSALEASVPVTASGGLELLTSTSIDQIPSAPSSLAIPAANLPTLSTASAVVSPTPTTIAPDILSSPGTSGCSIVGQSIGDTIITAPRSCVPAVDRSSTSFHSPPPPAATISSVVSQLAMEQQQTFTQPQLNVNSVPQQQIPQKAQIPAELAQQHIQSQIQLQHTEQQQEVTKTMETPQKQQNFPLQKQSSLQMSESEVSTGETSVTEDTCSYSAPFQPTSDSSLTPLHLGTTDAPLPALSLTMTPSPAQPSSVAESDSEGPPKIEFVDNRIKTLDEKLRNLLYQEYSNTSPHSSSSTTSPTPSRSSSTSPDPERDGVGEDVSSEVPNSAELGPVEKQPGPSLPSTSASSTPPTSLLPPNQDDAAGPQRPPVPGEPTILAVPSHSDTSTTGDASWPPNQHPIPLRHGQQKHNAGDGHSSSQALKEEKEAPPLNPPQSRKGRFQVTPVPQSSPPKEAPSGHSNTHRKVGRFSVSQTETKKKDRQTDSSPVSPDLERERRRSRAKDGEKEESKRTPAMAHLPRGHGHSHSPLGSSDDDNESELEDEDLRKELHKLREKHIKEVVSLQAQQNRELQELYRQLRSLKDQRQSLPTSLSRTPPLPTAPPALSPRRPRPAKIKLRPRPHSHIDNNGVTHSGIQQSSCFSGGEQSRLPLYCNPEHHTSLPAKRDHSPLRKSTFTDELHKLVDNWTKETVGPLPPKPSLNQIKQIQQVQELGGWSQQTEVAPPGWFPVAPLNTQAPPTPASLPVAAPFPLHRWREPVCLALSRKTTTNTHGSSATDAAKFTPPSVSPPPADALSAVPTPPANTTAPDANSHTVSVATTDTTHHTAAPLTTSKPTAAAFPNAHISSVHSHAPVACQWHRCTHR
ncbi:Serine/threonine-protein kinase WNK3 [Larimichthys crocea]|uniref:Uncharacterized protein n=1 Tax=Larimichthys crocea TaxID=215358 RepID=A0ACD3RCX7_LARCR|nr:Serine/threonine-protein kinase WNK3 [Larimichthys crocea]